MSNNSIPPFDPANPKASLEAIYTATIVEAEAQIAWYNRKRTPMKNGSQAIRVFTVLTIALGALCPLLDATNVTWLPEFGQWGYVLLAIGAGLMSYDRFFGLSTAWLRYALTGMALEKMLVQFRFDWMLATAQQADAQPTGADVLKHIQVARDFALQVHAQVKQETDAWAVEFQTSLVELQKTLGTARDTAKPGAIRLKLANGQKYSSVDILLNDRVARNVNGVGEALIDGVPPGRYEVVVVYTSNGNPAREARTVDVAPGALASAEFVLPP